MDGKEEEKKGERERMVVYRDKGGSHVDGKEGGRSEKKKGKRVFKSMNFLFLAIKITSAV